MLQLQAVGAVARKPGLSLAMGIWTSWRFFGQPDEIASESINRAGGFAAPARGELGRNKAGGFSPKIPDCSRRWGLWPQWILLPIQRPASIENPLWGLAKSGQEWVERCKWFRSLHLLNTLVGICEGKGWGGRASWWAKDCSGLAKWFKYKKGYCEFMRTDYFPIAFQKLVTPRDGWNSFHVQAELGPDTVPHVQAVPLPVPHLATCFPSTSFHSYSSPGPLGGHVPYNSNYLP